MIRIVEIPEAMRFQQELQRNARIAGKEFGWEDVAIIYNSKTDKYKFVEYTYDLHKSLGRYEEIKYVLYKTGNSTYRVR